MMQSEDFEYSKKNCDALDYLDQTVSVIMDRPLGSKHPKHGFTYPVNYGYVPNTISGDGEELDAYVLGIQIPKEKFTGKCVAIIHRTDDNDDKLVVVPEGVNLSDKEIEEAVQFQERWFHHIIIRMKTKDIQPILYIICGFLGAGKTTYSQKLAKEMGAVNLNPDEYCMKLFTQEEYEQNWNECFSKTIDYLWEKVNEYAKQKKSVIFDMGFWTKQSRYEAAEKAKQSGFLPIIHYLYASEKILKERISKRKGAIADYNLKHFDELKMQFEEPDNSEKYIKINTETKNIK